MADLTQLELILEDRCPDLRVSSCGGCGHLLVGEREAGRHGHFARGISPVFVRAMGVPFCKGCSSDGEVRFVLETRKKGVGK